MKVFCTQHYIKGKHYVEFDFTQHEIIELSPEQMIDYANSHNDEVYCGWAGWLNHCGRFIRQGDFNPDNIEVYYMDDNEWHKIDWYREDKGSLGNKGQIKGLPYGYFY